MIYHKISQNHTEILNKHQSYTILVICDILCHSVVNKHLDIFKGIL